MPRSGGAQRRRPVTPAVPAAARRLRCGLCHLQVEPSLTWTALCDTPPSSRLLPEKVVAAASLAAVGDLGEGMARVGGTFSTQWR